MKKRYYGFLSIAFIGILYIFSIIRATLMTMHVPVQAWHMLLFAVGSFIFYCLVNTKIGRIVFLTVILAGICYLAIISIRNGFTNIFYLFTPVNRIIEIMIQVGTGFYDDAIPYSSLMTAIGIYSLLVTFPIYYFLVKHYRFYLLIIPGLAFFMIVWGINRYVDKFSFYTYIIVAIVCYIRHIFQYNLRKNPNIDATNNAGSILIYFIPVALVVIIFSTLIPVSPKPIQWPWLDEKIYDFWWDMQTKLSIDRYDTFSLAKTGFGDPARLGGPVRPDNTPILLVKAPARVYLRGAVYDNYTGTGWELIDREKNNYLEDRVYDHRELMYGWKAAATISGILSVESYEEYLLTGSRLSKQIPSTNGSITEEGYVDYFRTQVKPQVLYKLFPEEKVSVQHLNVRTKSLFTPLKLVVPITGLSYELYKINEDIGGIFLSNRRIRGNSSYSINYLQPAYGMDELENHFNLSKPGLYSGYNQYNNDFFDEYYDSDSIIKNDLTDILDIYKKLARRRNEIYELYTGIPDDLPDRVRELTQDITYTSNTTYAKIKRLESYLRQNYEYTLFPQYPPEEQDFVDYFLFDGKEGYCSYFASALCIMTRSIGIPARYVEGFLLPEEANRNDNYQVTNQNAHAWVEVYLEGVGWVTFEPTPPMADALSYYVSLTEIESGEGGIMPEIPEEHGLDQNIPGYATPDLGMGDLNDVNISLVTILLYLLAAILAVIIANMLYIIIRWIILHLITHSKSVRFLYIYTVSLLSQAGCNIQVGETPKDYAKRVDERYKSDCMDMTRMVEMFYSVRFGKRSLDKKSRKQLFSFVWEIKRKTGRNMYFVRRVLFRCILFKG